MEKEVLPKMINIQNPLGRQTNKTTGTIVRNMLRRPLGCIEHRIVQDIGDTLRNCIHRNILYHTPH